MALENYSNLRATHKSYLERQEQYKGRTSRTRLATDVQPHIFKVLVEQLYHKLAIVISKLCSRRLLVAPWGEKDIINLKVFYTNVEVPNLNRQVSIDRLFSGGL